MTKIIYIYEKYLDRPISQTRNPPSHSAEGLERLGFLVDNGSLPTSGVGIAYSATSMGLVEGEFQLTWFLTTALNIIQARDEG